jgi:sec-independent protein translocase protein TatB
VFGLSFGEIVILGIVALVVVGPRRLPSMLRTAGQLIGKVRRMAMEIRAESGIDEILDAEGIRSEIDNFRKLATGEISPDEPERRILPDRDREYPIVGADSYGALSEDIIPYAPSPALEAAATASNGETAEKSSTDEHAARGEHAGCAEEHPGVGESARAPGDSGPSLASQGLSPTGADIKN